MPWRFASSSRSANAAAKEFDQLIRPHVAALYRSAYRWTGDVDRAEDLVQELLVRLFPKLDELRTIDQLRPWMLRVMYRIFVDQVRRERSSPVEFGHHASSDDRQDEELSLIDPKGDIVTIVERQLTQERILSAWSNLPKEHRVVLSMHDIEGYSLVDISQITDTPVGTLKSRLHRGRAKLRDLLDAIEP
jgi:RNA polymerase sigma factor (sigma-70 family)